MSSPDKEVQIQVENFVKSFGQKIRTIRKQRKMSLQALSSSTGLSIASLSQIERGIMAPSLSSVFMICHSLEIPSATFPNSADSSPEQQKYGVLIKKGEERLIHSHDGVNVYLLYSDEKHTIEVVKNIYGPHTSTGSSQYTHRGNEWGIVIKGCLRVELGDEAYILEEGDNISFDGKIPHKLVNIYPGNTIYIWLNFPPVWVRT